METSETYQEALQRGVDSLRQGDSADSLAYFQRAVDLALDNAQAADALAFLGRAYGVIGEYEHAEEALHESLRRATGSPAAMARVKMQIGVVRWLAGQLDAARYFLEEAEQELKRQGDQRNRAIALGNLGMILLTTGEYQPAIEALQGAIEACEALNDLVGVSIQYSNLGEAYFDLGDPARAQEFHERALRVADQLGSESLKDDTLRNLGMALAAQGRLADGRMMIERSLAIAESYHQQNQVLQCLASLAEVQLMAGEVDTALATAQSLQAASAAIPVYRAQARLLIGRCQLARREPQRALLTLESGLVDAQVSASKMLVLRLHAALAQAGSHPAIAQVHRRIAAELATQIAGSLKDAALRDKFERSELYKSVLV